jgi:hypothetical protein
MLSADCLNYTHALQAAFFSFLLYRYLVKESDPHLHVPVNRELYDLHEAKRTKIILYDTEYRGGRGEVNSTVGQIQPYQYRYYSSN